MTLYWTPKALADRRAIYDYLDVENPKAALFLDALFVEQAARLLAQPGIGRPGRVRHTRELVVHRNYVLIYDISDGRVRIIRILHTARQWPSGRG